MVGLPFKRDHRLIKSQFDDFGGKQEIGPILKKPSFCLYVAHLIVITLLVFLAIFLAPILCRWLYVPSSVTSIQDDMLCKITLVESMPEGLTYNGTFPVHLSTYEAWINMLKEAKQSVDIVSFYWTLTNNSHKSAWKGKSVLDELLAVLERGVKLRIIQNLPSRRFPNNDTEVLKAAGAEVLSLDMSKFFGSGVLHTKFWLIDGEQFYLGSANMDWRSLSQVKEAGALFTACGNLAKDASKLVEVYAYAATHNSLPKMWPYKYRTQFNQETPFNLKLNGTDSQVYFSSSPKAFCPNGRTSDIDAILDVIKKAKSFIYIAVMDYAPITEFEKVKRFWPSIDDALRKAAVEKNVAVRFLGSFWKQTKKDMIVFLKSLAVLRKINLPIDVKMFCVPSDEEQRTIPSARVNHNKYMVTDNAAYIGTSNWVADYFISTAGLSVVVNQTLHEGGQSFHKELLDIFERDWTSEHSISLWDLPNNYSVTC